jgi:hypothetical protein
LQLTRRTVTATGLAAIASPVLASAKRRVLFVGNSFTDEHDVPGLFRNLAVNFGYSVETEAIIENGAFLLDQIANGAYDRAIAHDPDILILQDHSTAALTAENRSKSGRAILKFGNLLPRKILFEPWPRERGHKLYSQPEMPETPRQMVEHITRHHQQMASMINAQVAPVARAWMLADGITLHRDDGYHANLAGAWLTALVLVRTAGMTSSAHPHIPDGLSILTAKRLYQIARMVAP